MFWVIVQEVIDEDAQATHRQLAHVDRVAVVAGESLEAFRVVRIHHGKHVGDKEMLRVTVETKHVVQDVGTVDARHFQKIVDNFFERSVISSAFQETVFNTLGVHGLCV